MKVVEADTEKSRNHRIKRSKKDIHVWHCPDGFIASDGTECMSGWYHEDPRHPEAMNLFLIGGFQEEKYAINSYKRELDLISDDEDDEEEADDKDTLSEISKPAVRISLLQRPYIPTRLRREVFHQPEDGRVFEAGWYFYDEYENKLRGPWHRREEAKTVADRTNPDVSEVKEPANPAKKETRKTAKGFIERSKETPHVFRLRETEDHDAGWYYWNEVVSDLIGPFAMESSALTSFRELCRQLNPEPAPPAPPIKGVPRPKEPETVNHPSHYNSGNIEVIDFIEDQGLGFNLGNAVKYVARAEHKGKPGDDLRKALWYVERELARREGTLTTTTEKNFAKKFRESNEDWEAVAAQEDMAPITITLQDGRVFEGVGKFKLKDGDDNLKEFNPWKSKSKEKDE